MRDLVFGLGLSIEELRYYFADELGYSVDRLLAETTARVNGLMRQSTDPATALRASELLLKRGSSLGASPPMRHKRASRSSACP